MMLSESISEIGLMVQSHFKVKCHDQCYVRLPRPNGKRQTRQETFKFGDLMRLILEILR